MYYFKYFFCKILILIFIQNLIAQKNQNLELQYFDSDNYYYNIIQSQNGVLIGSDLGIFQVLESRLELIDETLKGPISVNENSIIEQGEILYDDQYGSLLPAIYQISLQTFYETPTRLYIVSRGDLFVFKKTLFKVEAYPSIRTISENYIGTYEGILNRSKQKAFDSPTYTSSYIREFDSIVFINWDGLTLRNKKETKDYYDKDGKGIKIKDQLLGLANDVAQLSDHEYLLLTNTGVYQFNIQNEDITLIRPATSGTFTFVRDERSTTGVERIFIHDKESVIVYNADSNTFEELLRANDILSVFSNSASVFYVLTSSGLYYYNLSLSSDSKELISNIDGHHTIGYFKNFVFLTSDNGLSIYSVKDNRLANQTIKDEFNRKAKFVSEDTLYLGSVNGLYSLDYNTVNNLYLDNVQPYSKKGLPWYFYILTLALTIILILSIWIYRINDSKEITHPTLTEKNILKFIKKNLNTVSIESICLEFAVNPNEIYKILKNGKRPGEIIREERIKLVREMRKRNKSEEEISSATGFSISYLKKV